MKTLVAAVVVVLSTCAVRADDPPKGDLAKLQGKWKAMIGPNKDTPVTVVIKEKVVSATFTDGEGKEVTLKGELKLDEKAKPKTVDFVKFKGADGEDLPDNLGIYELDGDVWKVCNGGHNNPRPTDFKEGDQGPPNLLILKREKAEKPKEAAAGKPRT